MEVFALSHASAGAVSVPDDDMLDEAHWTYMDAFADRLIVRGPILAQDRHTWRGSLHVVDLSESDQANSFVANEPYNRAGLYAVHELWEVTDRFGPTIQVFEHAPQEHRFLIVARDDAGQPHRPAPDVERLPDSLVPQVMFSCGLRPLAAPTPPAVALIVQAGSIARAQEIATHTALDLNRGRAVEVVDWELGGRR